MRSIFLCNSEADVNYVYPEHLKQQLYKAAGLEQKVYDRQYVLAHPEKFQDVEHIFSTWGMPAFSQEEIARCFPNLKRLFYAAGTVQSFARPFLDRGVQVHSAWAANGVPVAEFTVSQIILANKGYFSVIAPMNRGDVELARQIWRKHPGTYNTRVGLIGVGMIGSMVAQLLQSYNVEVLGFDPFLSEEKAKALHVRKASLEEIFSTCQVVSNHLANNPQTQNMLHKALFASMPEHAVFINTGRGPQVVEQDLIQVLQQRPDLVALLDITDPEPPLAGSPFYALPNCILTPHIAGSSGNEVHRMAEYMLQEFTRFSENKPCLYEVTEKMLETMA